MPLKNLRILLESSDDQPSAASWEFFHQKDLGEIAARGNAELYRTMPGNIREQLLLFLRKIGLSETHVVLFNMLVEDKHPNVSTLRKLEEISDVIRTRAIKSIMAADQIEKKPATSQPKKENREMSRNPHRLLGAEEISARFLKLGVNVEKLVQDWEEFYATTHFSKAVQKSMVIEEYTLDLPAVTDRAMEAFEKAYRTGKIDCFMIDDARIGDGTTLRSLEKKTLKRFARKYNYTSNYEAEIFLNRTTTTPPIARIVGFSTRRVVFNKNGGEKTLQDYLPKELYHETMGLGTYLRLFHCFDYHDPETMEMVRTYTVKGCNAALERTILLSNRNHENHVLTIGPDPQDLSVDHSVEVGPGITQVPKLYETPVTVVTSADFSTLQNNNDFRSLAFMNTWPAPPIGEEGEDDIPF